MGRIAIALAVFVLVPSAADAWRATIGRGHPWAFGGAEPALTGLVAVDPAGNPDAITMSSGRLAVTEFDVIAGKRSWLAILEEDARPEMISVDAAGDVVAAAGYPIEPVVSEADHLLVAKMDGDLGTVLWRRDFTPRRGDPRSGPLSTPFVTDAAGAVFVGWENLFSAVGAVKLDPATGDTLWQRGWLDLREPWVAVDSANDFVIASSRTTTDAVRVTKLDGDDGTTLWEVDAAIPASPNSLDNIRAVIAPNGDVFVGVRTTIIKLDGTTGAEEWRTGALGGIWTHWPTPVPNGDLVLFGATLMRLDGTTGAVAWQQPNASAAFVVRPTGDVITHDDGVLHHLDGATGAILWTLPILAPEVGPRGDLALGPQGLVGLAITRILSNNMATADLLAIATRLTGDKLDLRDSPSDPAARKLEVKVKDPRFTPPRPDGSPQDPRVSGAVVTIENPTTLESGIISLPAGGWTAKGGPGKESYKFKNANCSASGASGLLIVKCKGALGGFTLDEPAQGSLRVTIELGNDGPPYCLEFGGLVLTDAGSGGGNGVFRARKAPAPVSCPGGF